MYNWLLGPGPSETTEVAEASFRRVLSLNGFMLIAPALGVGDGGRGGLGKSFVSLSSGEFGVVCGI